MKVCGNCRHWDRAGEWVAPRFLMRACLADRAEGWRAPFRWLAEDGGKTCPQHEPRVPDPS